MYLTPWFMALYTSLPCWDAVLVIWDLLLLEGAWCLFWWDHAVVTLCVTRCCACFHSQIMKQSKTGKIRTTKNLQTHRRKSDLKPLAKRTRKSTQVCKTRTCVRTFDGRPNVFASSRKSQKVVNFTRIQLTCDRLVSTCDGRPNGEKRASTCLQIWARPNPTQGVVLRSHRKIFLARQIYHR